MSERRVPAPHHIYSEDTNLESFSVSRLMGLLTAQVTYVENVTPIPADGQIVEFHVLGTSVQGIVNDASLMSGRDDVSLLTQATRIKN
jgi:hypothetical protein